MRRFLRFFLPGLFYGGFYLRIIGLGLFQKQLARAGSQQLGLAACKGDRTVQLFHGRFIISVQSQLHHQGLVLELMGKVDFCRKAYHHGDACHQLGRPQSNRRHQHQTVGAQCFDPEAACTVPDHIPQGDVAVESALFDVAEQQEKAPLGKQILQQLQQNMDIAGKDMIPICQDTGMAVVFLEVGQDVHLTGGNVEDAVNEGVRQGYVDGYLRKSVVKDPIYRENTKDNTPAIIHYSIVPGDRVRITVAPKGFGSENMSRVFMLKPADGIEGVKNAILTAVKDAGPNACPPMVVGVGIGGTFEKCALMAKKALTRPVDEHSEIPYVRELEEELLEKINKTGIGPGGLGGSTTALAVNISTYPTHIAGLPVAVNICCHVNRHAVREI